MSRERSQQPRQLRRKAQDAVTRYLTALLEVHPDAKGKAHVTTREDNRIIVSIPLPARVSERMQLFDRMAEVGTELLLETDQYIILSGR